MRLIYLFTSDGAAGLPGVPWDKNKEATNIYVQPSSLPTEGFFWLLRRLIEEKIVDDVLIFVESASGTGSISWLPDKKLTCYVVPHISDVDQFIKDGDVILARGGFRSWPPFLERMQQQKRWILFYQAATQRGSWPFWDVVLNDLVSENFVDSDGRYHLAFLKPTHPGIFYPMINVKPVFDVCIGASHIHDRKAQWKGVKMAAAYKQQFGEDLRCVLPGRIFRGEKTNQILNDIKNSDLKIEMPGMVPRVEVGKILNKTKIFLHLGESGQNDRGVLEAMRCGCFVVMASPRHHAPFTYANKKTSLVTAYADDPAALAKEIHELLKECDQARRRYIVAYYSACSGVEDVIIPQMKKLFTFLGEYKQADREKMREVYGLPSVPTAV